MPRASRPPPPRPLTTPAPTSNTPPLPLGPHVAHSSFRCPEDAPVRSLFFFFFFFASPSFGLSLSTHSTSELLDASGRVSERGGGSVRLVWRFIYLEYTQSVVEMFVSVLLVPVCACKYRVCVCVGVIGIGTGEFGFLSRGKMALLRDGSFCSAVLILVSAFVSKERNVARCLGPLEGLLRLFARQPSSRLEDSLSRLGLACHVFILFSAHPRVVSHGKTSHILCVCISRVTRCKKGINCILPKNARLPGVFISASGNIVSGSVAGVEAMPLPKPFLLPLNLPQVAFSRRMLGTFCRGCRSQSMGNSSPVSGFLLTPCPQTSHFLFGPLPDPCLTLGQPSEMALHSFGKHASVYVRMNVGIIPPMARCPQALWCVLLESRFYFFTPVLLSFFFFQLYIVVSSTFFPSRYTGRACHRRLEIVLRKGTLKTKK